MTDLIEATAAAAPPADRGELAQVASVADSFVELMRSFNRARARLVQATAHDVEWSSHMILRCVQNAGTLRAGAVAECLQTDPSTVSRQVAALVKDGFLERRADPDDGRASLLVVTDRAGQVLADHDRIRVEYFAELMRDWSADDLETFAGLLSRFSTAYEAADDRWIKERLASRADRAGSND